MRAVLVFGAVALTIGACSGTVNTPPLTAPAAGIYSLAPILDSDPCGVFAGTMYSDALDFAVLVTTDPVGSTMTITVPADIHQRYGLGMDSTQQVLAVTSGAVTVPMGMDSCGQRTLSITASNAKGFDIAVKDAWAGNMACVPMSNKCTSSYKLHYTQKSECDGACIKSDPARPSQPHALVCKCTDGGASDAAGDTGSD